MQTASPLALFVVHYTDRFGRPTQSAAMPHSVATSYARTVSNPRIEAANVTGTAPVIVQRVAPGTATAQQEAARKYYAKAPPPWATAAGRRGMAEARALLDTAEAREERMARRG